MISLTCTSCNRSLEIDDAFAGGVCRCQFCGTIQTVPANLKTTGRPATPVGGAGTPQKALYQRKTPRKPATAPMTTADASPPESAATSESLPSTVAGSAAARPAEPGAAQRGGHAARRKRWLLIGIAIGAAAALAIGIAAAIA